MAAMIDALRYDPRAEHVPWDGGALYVPGIQWNRTNARAMLRELGNWYAWAQRTENYEAQTQAMNNMGSISLLGAAGYSSWDQALRGGL